MSVRPSSGVAIGPVQSSCLSGATGWRLEKLNRDVEVVSTGPGALGGAGGTLVGALRGAVGGLLLLLLMGFYLHATRLILALSVMVFIHRHAARLTYYE